MTTNQKVKRVIALTKDINDLKSLLRAINKCNKEDLNPTSFTYYNNVTKTLKRQEE
jgi:hypothetical protein